MTTRRETVGAAATLPATGAMANPRQTFTVIDQDGQPWDLEILQSGNPPLLATPGGQSVEWISKGKYRLVDKDADDTQFYSESPDAP